MLDHLWLIKLLTKNQKLQVKRKKPRVIANESKSKVVYDLVSHRGSNIESVELG